MIFINEIDKVTLVMSNDKTVDAEILGGDQYLDLAVLRIAKEDVIQVANIGNSENAKLGDTVFTVGSPMGYDYRGSVTSGILSGKERMVTVSVSSSSNDWVMRVLQLDASINPGNSGGPLLNANGEVIGICSLKLVDDQIEGMGFAIPIEYAMSHASALENKEEMVKRHIAIEILLYILIGKSSKLYQELYKEGLIISQPDLDYEFSKQYAHITVSGQSNNPEKLAEKFKNEINELKQNGREEKIFERVKRKIYGDYVTEFNDVSNIARMFMSDYFKGINSFEYIETQGCR